jgi:hypothetical protein
MRSPTVQYLTRLRVWTALLAKSWVDVLSEDKLNLKMGDYLFRMGWFLLGQLTLKKCCAEQLSQILLTQLISAFA